MLEAEAERIGWVFVGKVDCVRARYRHVGPDQAIRAGMNRKAISTPSGKVICGALAASSADGVKPIKLGLLARLLAKSLTQP